jgi:hypothetical protein
MSKADPIQDALQRLAELRHAEPSNQRIDELRRFLGSRSNLVVARAAKVGGQLRLGTLIPDLLSAFNRLMADAPRLDQRCAAITEIVGALYELDYDEPGPYLRGLKHFQPEASFGTPVDAAAKLRGLSAQGLLRTRYPDALTEVVPLLVDCEAPARLGAIRALAVNGGEAGALLLRLKVLTGDADAEVLSECFAGLLAASPDKSIPFVARYIDSEDRSIADVAALALGESRLEPAFAILREKWGRTVETSHKRVLLLSIAASRLEEAIAFLVSRLESESPEAVKDVLEALALYRRNERVTESVRNAVLRRGDKNVAAHFVREFENMA